MKKLRQNSLIKTPSCESILEEDIDFNESFGLKKISDLNKNKIIAKPYFG